MKATDHFPRWNFWVWCFALLMTGAVYASYLRFTSGISPSGPPDSAFPWTLIVGLNVLCGIAIAAGGFTVAASVYVLNLTSYRSIARVSLLISFIGYIVAILGVVSSRGRIVPQIGSWGSHSILFGIVWAFILFGAVLVLEFVPDRWEDSLDRKWLTRLHSCNMPLLFLAVVFSVVYQTNLADLLQSLPAKVSPIWSTPQLPFFFFVSAVCAGLATIIFASWHLDVSSGQRLLPERVAGLGRVLAVLLFIYLGLRVADLIYRGIPLLVWENKPENLLLGLEMGLILLPMLLLVDERTLANPRLVYLSSGMVLAGLITNRLNTSITSTETAMNLRYLPDWSEFLVSYGIVGLGIATFTIMSKRLRLFS